MAKTKAALARVEAQVEAASPEAAKVGGEAVGRQMLARAPRRTGALVASIDVDVSSFGDGATAKVGANVPYDRFVQKGTRYMSAQPYGQDAADAATPAIVAAAAAIFKAAAER